MGQIGRVVSRRYRLDEFIGEGYMGHVYRCWDYEEAAPRALKLLRSEHLSSPTTRMRFIDEAHILMSLRHPHIVWMHHLGQDSDGTLFMVMELLEGRDLFSIVRQGIRLSHEHTIQLVTQIGDALQAVHAAGYVHRDIKLSNLFLVRNRGAARPCEAAQAKIIDFGFARPLADEVRHHGSDGFVVCTPQYVAPELLAHCRADEISDQWALGVVVYQLLSGRHPFELDDGLSSMIARIRLQDPAPLRACAPDIPSHMEAAVQRALSKRPEHRFPNLPAFVAALSGAAASAEPTPVRSLARSKLEQVLLRTTLAGGIIAAGGLLAHCMMRPASAETALPAAAVEHAQAQSQAAATPGGIRPFRRLVASSARLRPRCNRRALVPARLSRSTESRVITPSRPNSV